MFILYHVRPAIGCASRRTLCARILCVGSDEALCTTHRCRSPSKYPRRISVSACVAMGSRLKFTVAVAMRHRVLHRGSAVASTACHRHRVWLAEGASRLAAPARSGSCASRGIVVVSLCRPPCTAQGLRARSRRSMRSFAASSMGLRITARSRRHPTAQRLGLGTGTSSILRSQAKPLRRGLRLTSNVRALGSVAIHECSSSPLYSRLGKTCRLPIGQPSYNSASLNIKSSSQAASSKLSLAAKRVTLAMLLVLPSGQMSILLASWSSNVGQPHRSGQALQQLQ
jgi:hypothetical protein